MSWKDTLKKSIKKLAFPDVSYSDINEMLDVTDFAHQDAHVPSSPPSQWRQKISGTPLFVERKCSMLYLI